MDPLNQATATEALGSRATEERAQAETAGVRFELKSPAPSTGLVPLGADGLARVAEAAKSAKWGDPDRTGGGLAARTSGGRQERGRAMVSVRVERA